MVDTAVTPIIGVVIGCDCDIDGREILYVHGIEGVDKLLSLF